MHFGERPPPRVMNLFSRIVLADAVIDEDSYLARPWPGCILAPSTAGLPASLEPRQEMNPWIIQRGAPHSSRCLRPRTGGRSSFPSAVELSWCRDGSRWWDSSSRFAGNRRMPAGLIRSSLPGPPVGGGGTLPQVHALMHSSAGKHRESTNVRPRRRLAQAGVSVKRFVAGGAGPRAQSAAGTVSASLSSWYNVAGSPE